MNNRAKKQSIQLGDGLSRQEELELAKDHMMQTIQRHAMQNNTCQLRNPLVLYSIYAQKNNIEGADSALNFLRNEQRTGNPHAAHFIVNHFRNHPMKCKL